MTASSNQHIGIIAGSGQFPRLVAENAKKAGFAVVICGFEGYSDPALVDIADSFTMVHLGQFNKAIAFFRSHNVQTLCMAGSIDKPSALNFRPDTRAMRILFSLRNKGDDALLKAIIQDLENEGFQIVAPSSFIDTLHAPHGVLTKTQPSQQLLDDLAFGWPVAESFGFFDIGQCIVVREKIVVAVECLEGTDATLRRGASLTGKGCVAIKRAKPGQEERADLPSVGLETVRILIDNQYLGLVVEAEKSLFFDREQAIELADAHGLCIIACSASGEIQSL